MVGDWEVVLQQIRIIQLVQVCLSLGDMLNNIKTKFNKIEKEVTVLLQKAPFL